MGHLLPKLQVGIKIWDNRDINPLFDWLSQKRPFFRWDKSTEINVKQEKYNRDPRNWTLWVICNLNYWLASKFRTIGIKIPIVSLIVQKEPFFRRKIPRKPTSTKKDNRDRHIWTLWVICYLNYWLASKFKIFWTKIHFLTDCPKKKTFFRRKKSMETNVKPPYDIRDPRNWTLCVICYLNYRLASKLGKIGTKSTFWLIVQKIPFFLEENNHRNQCQTTVWHQKPPQLDFMGHLLPILHVGIKIWDNWDKNPLFDWLSQKKTYFRRK